MEKQTVAKVVSKKLKECKAKGKKQSQIAIEAGFKSANMITHIKQGKSKLPPEKAPALAKAIDMDVKELLFMALNEKWEGVGDFIESNLEKFRRMYLIEKTFWETVDDSGINYDELTESEKKKSLLSIGKSYI